MAYIMLTTRCNFKCDHCCRDSTPRGSREVGRDISIETFKKAAKLFEGQSLSLGGGEPTLHPKFWEILGISLRYAEFIWLATNGSQTNDALVLASISKNEILSVELSRDNFHDEIDERVVKAFGSHVRRVTRILPVGRAKKTGVWTEDKGCPCGEITVTPDGRIWLCGHKKKQLGTVNSPDREGINSIEDVYDSCSEKEV